MSAQPESKSAHRVVGIIGGMGPEATVDLMRRVIAKTPVRDDQDHVHLIVESNPKIPSRIAHLIEGSGPDPTPELIRIAVNLQRAGADALAIACNTAHAYADAIRHAVSIPLLDMVSLTVDGDCGVRLYSCRIARIHGGPQYRSLRDGILGSRDRYPAAVPTRAGHGADQGRETRRYRSASPSGARPNRA